MITGKFIIAPLMEQNCELLQKYIKEPSLFYPFLFPTEKFLVFIKKFSLILKTFTIFAKSFQYYQFIEKRK